MTAIDFPYSEYPVLKNGKTMLTKGMVRIELGETPVLPVCPPNVKEVIMVDRPLQRPLRWQFTSELAEDLRRFIRGRYWPLIERLLFAQFLEEKGLPDHARGYRIVAKSGIGS
jgi:hypothetical protein